MPMQSAPLVVVKVTDPVTFVVVALAFLLVSAVASWVSPSAWLDPVSPARRVRNYAITQ